MNHFPAQTDRERKTVSRRIVSGNAETCRVEQEPADLAHQRQTMRNSGQYKMQFRHRLAALFLMGVAVTITGIAGAQTTLDEISQQASQLEAELGKYNDATPLK